MEQTSGIFHVTIKKVQHYGFNCFTEGSKAPQRLACCWFAPCANLGPDTRRDDFAKECLRQSRLLANDPLESDTSEWPQTVADTEGWK
jgi:hypothetical protein